MIDKAFRKTGHYSQLFGVEEHRLVGGRGDGLRILQVRNGKGLSATVAADRCMDIYRLEYKGDNLGYFSPAGFVAPAYYSDKGNDFLRSFTAGFLTTCGLSNVGPLCEDEAGWAPTHGRIGNLPAEQVSYSTDYSGTQPAITLCGRVSDGVMFAEKMTLERRLCIHTDENIITLHDTITNEGGEDQPLLILYHMNMGYPLLDEGVEIMIPTAHVRPRDLRAQEGVAEWDRFPAPVAGFAEQCYSHTLHRNEDGSSSVAIYNRAKGKGIQISLCGGLKCFTQWTMAGVRDYVLGLEPGNCEVEGRDDMRRRGILETIDAGQQRTFNLRIRIIDGDEEAAMVRAEINRLQG